MDVYAVFKTGFGWCGLVRNETGLKRIILPEQKKARVVKGIKELYPDCFADPEAFSREIEGMKAYFAGCSRKLLFRLDYSGATDFQRRVWSATAEIPYGRTLTYGDIAQKIGNRKAFRAVGNALGKNPFPVVIPCHRVVKRDGTPGGFTAAEGTRLKRKMLQLEKGPC